jgi:two-component system, OmpR family, sensor histidine kinase KdpD
METSTPRSHGKLKAVLGYAAGVGKTFRMLDEGQQLKAAGRDVVIGYFEPHARADTIAKTEGLPVVPRKVVEYRGKQFEEMDTDAILARRPEICLVDEFPHSNVPGSLRTKRWEDVLVLLEAGIDVITTMNIQHLESLNDQIREITGVQVRETVPDWVLKRAEELVLVDLTPGALLNRLDRGVVYAPEKAKRAKENFFKEPTLAALREMALRQAAHEVEVNQRNGPSNGEALEVSPAPATSDFGLERILIYVTPSPSTAALIRRGRRVADYLGADCFAVVILPDGGMEQLPVQDRETLERHLSFAQKLRIETRIISSPRYESEASALVDFARRNRVTQVFVNKPGRAGFASWLFRRDFIANMLRQAGDIQVTVVADRRVR